MRAEILGVRLVGAHDARARAVGPIETLEVPLGRGLTALAGLNGAGKSRILQGVAAALNGRAWPGGTWQLLVCLDDGESLLPALEQVIGDFLTDTRRSDFLPDSPGFDGWGMSWRDWMRSSLEEDLARDGGYIGDHDGVARALALQGAFSVTVDERSEVRVSVAVDRRTEDPALVALLGLVDSGWDDLLRELRSQAEKQDPDDVGCVYAPLGGFGESWYLGRNVASNLYASPYAGALLPVPLHELSRRRLPEAGWPIETLDVDSAAGVTAMTERWLGRLLANADDALELMSLAEGDDDGGVWPIQAWQDRFEAVLSTAETGEQPSVSRPVRALDVLALEATHTYQMITGDKLALVCWLHPAHTWLGPGERFTWLTFDPASGRRVAIDALSQSQCRWARFAVAAALHRAGPDDGPDAPGAPWLLMDEPEAGVHRAGERRLAHGLRDLADELGAGVVVATHSPAMVEQASNAHVVTRGENGAVVVEELPGDARDLATSLGLAVTDLLGWYRQLLFVEGAHDEAVVRAFLASELDETRTLVVPMRGVKDSAAVVDARLLQFTEGHAVVLIDGVGARAASEWQQLKELAAAGDLRAARRHAESVFAGGSHEERFLRECAGILLNVQPSIARVDVQALDVGDIVELLPAPAVLGCSTTWPDARARYAAERPSESFKDWAAHTYRCPPISVNRVRRVAEQMQTVPPAMQQLAAALMSAADGSQSGGDGS